MTLTERIRIKAKAKNLTFASLERLAGFGQGTIRKWDNNKPSSDKLHKVASLLDTSADWLLTGIESKNDNDSHIPVVSIGRGGSKVVLDISPEEYERVKKLLKAAFDDEIDGF